MKIYRMIIARPGPENAGVIDKTLENYSHCKRLDYKHFSESL